MSIPTPVILDISEWQVPSAINYDKLAKAIDGAIVRIQYGSNYTDKHYKTHIAEFQKRGIPVAVYAWVRGSSNADMEVEAADFYNRAKAYNPTFWWLDVEEKSMSDMRTGVERYRAKLKSLGAKKVGAYIANHLYASFNLDTSKFDGIWIPTYGSNNGQYNGSNPTATSNYDIHQYTSNGKLDGYSGALDLNRIVKRGFDYFFGGGSSSGQSTTNPFANITIDSNWDTNLNKYLQQHYKLPILDGIISGQIKGPWNSGITGIQYGTGGSNLVAAIQKDLGIPVDRNMGPGTIRSMQKKAGTPEDGEITRPSALAKQIKTNLKTKGKPW